MDNYTVNFSIRAEAAYSRIKKSASETSTESASNTLLQTVDRLIDSIPLDPFGNNRLTSPLRDIYWVSEGCVRIYYTPSSEPSTLVIIRISTSVRHLSSVQRVQAILRMMIASGQLNPLLVQAGVRPPSQAALH
jgi:hypothetical protein